MDHSRRIAVQYGIELGGALLLLGVSLAVRDPLAAGAGAAAPFVLALPVVPLWLIFASIWRHYLRVDEYQRLQFLKATTLALGIGLFVMVSLPFFTAFGLPRSASDALWLIVPAGWFVALAVVNHRQGR